MSRLLHWSVGIVVVLAFGELTSRTDDWIFQDVPILANPDRESDLLVRDEHGIRGRPGGQFKKYKLNAFGFRGPEIAKAKKPEITRIAILGASETFGLYESEDGEYPALVRAEFAKRGDAVEVVNAAVAGMALPSLTKYWRHWVKDFAPDWVVVYPSPLFYLDDDRPKASPPGEPAPSAAFRSRFLERLKETAKRSDLLKEIRVRYVLSRASRGKDASWFFDEVPRDRLEAFEDDLKNLVKEITASGARVALVTHAFKCDLPLSEVDRRELDAFRIFFPRALPETMVKFEGSANEAIRRVGRDTSAVAIDAAAALTGRRELFADPVHFNDAGSKAMAEVVVRELAPRLPAAGECR